MAKTYDPIATQTLGSAQATVTFSSIPATYTDLVLIASTKQSAASAYTVVYVNNVNAVGNQTYSQTVLRGDGTNATSFRASNQDYFIPTQNNYESTSEFLITRYQIQNYSNTTTFKSLLWRGDVSSILTNAAVGVFRSTNAINRIDFNIVGSSSYAIGSTFTLYGIKAA